mgnify:CR=1 FL=1
MSVHGGPPRVPAGGGRACGARMLEHSARKLECARTSSEPVNIALLAERPSTHNNDACRGAGDEKRLNLAPRDAPTLASVDVVPQPRATPLHASWCSSTRCVRGAECRSGRRGEVAVCDAGACHPRAPREALPGARTRAETFLRAPCFSACALLLSTCVALSSVILTPPRARTPRAQTARRAAGRRCSRAGASTSE